MDSDQSIIRNLVLGFLLKQRIKLRTLDLDSLLRFFPLSDDNPDVKKLVLLKELELEVQKKPVSETFLHYLEQLAEVEFERGFETVSDALKHAYCAVVVECSLSLLKCWVDGDNDCSDAVKRIWGGRIGSKDKVLNRLDSEELCEWHVNIEAAILDCDIRQRIVKNLEGFDAIGAIKAYLSEEEGIMGPSFLELVASKCGDDRKLIGIYFTLIREQKMNVFPDEIEKNGELKKNEKMPICNLIVRDVGNADQCTAKVTEEYGNANELDNETASIDRISGDDRTIKESLNGQVLEDKAPNVPIDDAGNELQGKRTHLRHKLVGLRRSTRRHGSRIVRGAKLSESDEMESDSSKGIYNLPRSSEVKRVQKSLKLSSSDLHASVNDPFPKALQFALTVCGTQTNNKGKDIIQENQAESSVPICDANGVFQTSRIVNDFPRPSIMERNSTAHTIRWEDDSISESDDDRGDTEYGVHLTTPRAINIPHLKAYEPNKKRRATRRWSVLEEDTLRTGVNKYGRGNWKTILNACKDVFEERTEVDLKDKWRNMTRG